MRTVLMIFALALWSCSDKSQPGDEAHEHHEVSHADYEMVQHAGLMLSESQVRLGNITTQKVSSTYAERLISANARLVSNEDLTGVVSARMQGRLEKLYPRETGKSIRKGEPLYEIYSEQLLTLQNEFLMALAQYETFKSKRYEEYLKSARKKLVLYGLAEKQINKLAESRIIQQRVTFLAPTSGIIKEIKATEGQYVNEGDALYKLEDTRQLWVETELYPGEATNVKPGTVLILQVNGYENEPVESKVQFVSPEYRANSQVLLARSTLMNEHHQWKPGMQGQVFLRESVNSALTIPTDAVIRDQSGAMVFVKSAESTYEHRVVKTGMETFTSIQILEGLKEGEEVVISGAYLIYSELVLKNGTEALTHHHEN